MSFQKNQIVSGFRVLRLVELKNIGSELIELTHIKTGARYVHIKNADKENAFAVAFKTVPADSTGVAHILEHTVLTGSLKYPVRDPFFSMLRRSLETFMNAFTSNDWTAYPFATTNKKDYYNLMSVYLDAVFYPMLSNSNFMQEGWRYDFDGERLTYQGIVYNEMKGVVSSPDEVLSYSINKTLFPTTPYHHNSGGDPKVIPDLTHAQLKAFHDRYYHPSNAFFYSYGNLPLAEHLKKIDRIISHFDKIDPKSDVPKEKKWKQPKSATFFYPLGKSESAVGKCLTSITWLLFPIEDTAANLAFNIINEVLIGNPGSPLRVALLDSGLGSDLVECAGIEDEFKFVSYTIGLKHIKVEKIKVFNDLVNSTLKELIRTGLPEKMVASAIHQIEISQKEITSHPHPFGIDLWLKFVSAWLHGVDPVRIIMFDHDLKEVRARIAQGRYLEGLIQKYLIDNPHRATITLKPDKTMAEKEEKRVQAELARKLKQFSQEEIETIKQKNQDLVKLQSQKEDISVLPQVKLSDVKPDIDRIKSEQGKVLMYHQVTNGFCYVRAIFKIKQLPDELLDYLPFFAYVLPRIGTRKHGYIELAGLSHLYTGGIFAGCDMYTINNQKKSLYPFLVMSAKCLNRHQSRMLGLTEEILLEYDFSDIKVLKKFLLEKLAQKQSELIPEGYDYAALLSEQGLCPSGRLRDRWFGINQYLFLKKLAQNLNDKKLNDIAGKLNQIGQLVINNSVKMAVTGEKAANLKAEKSLSNFLDSLPAAKTSKELEVDFKGKPTAKAFALESQVSFTAKAKNTIDFLHPDSPVLLVVSRLLYQLYLHPEIREKGGAYGGFAKYDIYEGIFNFGSFRDPKLYETLQVYEQAPHIVALGRFTDQDVEEAIISACAAIDKPLDPHERAMRDLNRKISHVTDEQRLKFKQRLLKVKKEDCMRVAKECLDDKDWGIGVIASKQKIQLANEKLTKKLKIIEDKE